ncbi:MAG: hypothetical protein ACKVT1_17690 [Dehalococcoidia bacterium]
MLSKNARPLPRLTTTPEVDGKDDGAPMDTAEKSRLLANAFLSATQQAHDWGFDLPSATASHRAQGLLARLAHVVRDVQRVDVAVGEDGTVEINVLSRRELATIDIPPNGSRLEMIRRDRTSGAVRGPAETLTEAMIVERIERAA